MRRRHWKSHALCGSPPVRSRRLRTVSVCLGMECADRETQAGGLPWGAAADLERIPCVSILSVPGVVVERADYIGKTACFERGSVSSVQPEITSNSGCLDMERYRRLLSAQNTNKKRCTLEGNSPVAQPQTTRPFRMSRHGAFQDSQLSVQTTCETQHALGGRPPVRSRRSRANSMCLDMERFRRPC